MFVKIYTYKIRKKDISKSNKIEAEAAKIYQKYGWVVYFKLFKEEKNNLKFLLLEFYKSKTDFLRIMRNVNRDREINELYKAFLKIVINKKIIQDDFEAENNDFKNILNKLDF